MKRPSEKQLAAGRKHLCTDESFLKLYPTLCAYLTDAKWDDGKEREVSTFTVSMGPSGVQVGLNDKAMSRSAYCTAGSLSEALALLEDGLKADSIGWRPWKGKK